MKIGNNPEPIASASSGGLQRSAKAPASAAESAVKTATTAPAAGVPVSVSVAARALDPTSRAAPDFNADKVKAVKAAIENGTFSVDASAIADQLLANAQEIFARAR